MELDFHKYYKHPFSYERVSYQRSRGHSTTIRLRIMVRVFFDFIKFHKSMKNTYVFNKIIDFHYFLCFFGMGSHAFSKKSVGIDAEFNFAYFWTNTIRYFINKIGKNLIFAGQYFFLHTY